MSLPALRYTLLSDGRSDDVLLHVLRWVLISCDVALPLDGIWADPRVLPEPRAELAARIRRVLEVYPCDLLFVHRDAEAQDPSLRHNEIRDAVRKSGISEPAGCVVPVRMTEAWLLFDLNAIRQAAGNPEGTEALDLPKLHEVERLSDPKSRLHGLIRAASGLAGRRLKRLKIAKAVRRLAEITEDYSPLKSLPAFQRLLTDVRSAVVERGWNRRAR